MCGIIGVLSSAGVTGSHKRETFFRQSLFADVFRGFDSTGMFLANGKTNEVWTCKRQLPAWDFLDMKTVDNGIKKMDKYQFAVGHNRAATRGRVIAANAHPFTEGSITGVHNGTLRNTWKLDDSTRFDVDSQALFHNIDLHGEEKVLKEVEGALALVWYDADDQTLNIIRNAERPLFYALGKTDDSVYFASEKLMLAWMLDRNKIEHEDIQPFIVGKQYIFNTDKVKEFTTRDRELYVPPVVKHNYNDRFRNQQNGRPPIPANRSHHRSARRPHEEILGRVGLKVDEYVYFHASDFTAYSRRSTKGKGSVEGFTTHRPYYSVKAHSVWDHEYEQLNGIQIKGKVKSAYYPDGNKAKDPIIIVDGSSLKKVEGGLGKPESHPGNKEGKQEGQGKHSLLSNSEEVAKLPPPFRTDDSFGADLEDGEEWGAFDTVGTLRGPAGIYIPTSEWLALIEDGCENCTQPVYASDHETTGWTTDRKPVCHSCLDDMATIEGMPGYMVNS